MANDVVDRNRGYRQSLTTHDPKWTQAVVPWLMAHFRELQAELAVVGFIASEQRALELSVMWEQVDLGLKRASNSIAVVVIPWMPGCRAKYRLTLHTVCGASEWRVVETYEDKAKLMHDIALAMEGIPDDTY